MELLFLYINETDNGFINKQGFNFSPNYKFEMTIEQNDYVLREIKVDKKFPEYFFDDTKCISNVTAVVGKNGSGKSTLLSELSSLQFYVKDEEHTPEYDDYFGKRYVKEKRAAVFKEKKSFFCYHNIDSLINETGAKTVYLYQGSPAFQYIMGHKEGYENISTIYLTNSAYSIKSGVFIDGCISNRIFFNADVLDKIKAEFYKRCIKKNHSIEGGYSSYIDLCRSQKKMNDFQQILDVLYIGFVYEREDKGILSKNIHPNLYVSFQLYTRVIRDILDKSNRQQDGGENDKNILIKAHNKLKEIIGKPFIEVLKKDSICIAYCDLLYEIIVYNMGNVIENMSVIDSKDNLKADIESMMESDNSIRTQFESAYNEIEEFEGCLGNSPQTECLLPVEDMAYDSKIEVEYGSTSYKRFLSLIEKYAIDEKHSFIMKYISIGGLQFSSGERALLNFFSWLHLVPILMDILGNEKESLKDNVLLLIDEIDLYCHPEWQQKMLYYLIDEARMLFHGKNVQIIFATHSPIVLSDMPKSNIIYLTRDEEKEQCRIDEPEKHDETFGASIYKLFDDAFFLEEQGQVGEFAKRKIRRLIEQLKPVQENNGKFRYPCIDEETAKKLEQEISIVGEPIIRDKLYAMFCKSKMKVGCEGEALRDKMIKVYEEKIRQLRDGENR